MHLLKCFTCLQLKNSESITKLDFSNTNLSEVFPQIWQYERTLEELNLTSARLNSLPPQLFYCQSLRILVVSSNNLESLPSALGSLRQLQQLSLYRNLISNVPDTIKCCKNLTHLDLSCNNLQRLPDAITSVISLQELLLNETYLEFLPANFGRLVNLKILELRLNNLITLPKSMVRLSNLQRIDIGGNEFTELPELIGELKQLRELWIDLNQIRRISLNIGKLKELQHFEANGNLLQMLPNEIINWQKLEVLSICMNNLETFPFNMGTMKFLVTLKCESNELQTIPDGIANLEGLEELVLSHNHLTCLPSSIGMLRKLRFLFVDDNLLNALPDELCSCSDLRVLSVCGNRLVQLPQYIGNLNKLTVLNVVNNHITSLPVSVLSLTNLQSLWLSNNQSQPLVPLQYVESSNKTQLTCFMLPQLAPRPTYSKEDEEFTLKSTSQSSVNCSKRICFAEETTVVTSTPVMHNKSKKSVIISSISMDQESPEARLLRSPTPFPKELRLMAKNLRNGQKDDSHQFNVKQMEDSPRTANTEINGCNELSNDNSINSYIYGKYNQCQPEPMPNSTIFTYAGAQYEVKNQNESAEINKTNSKQFSISEPQQNQVINNFSSGNILPITSLPPPYHIARSFTKKSPEDLTKYDVLSQKLLKVSENNATANEVDMNDISTENIVVPNKHALVHLDHQNNFLNNINISTPEKESTQHFQMQYTQDNLSTSLSELSISSGNSLTTSTSSNCKIDRNKTPWLFGRHKNPTVKQICIKWDIQLGFDISELSNQEGIYVSSVVPNTNASRMLCLKDKLLEVDGCDFTNIKLSEAKRILGNPSSMLNIMISRV